jgi:uncharacterized delta-60 repeat protein
MEVAMRAHRRLSWGVVALLTGMIQLTAASSAIAAGGDLDRSFGDEGKVTTFFGGPGSTSSVEAIAVQSDGKVVAVGGVTTPDGKAFALARYSLDGSLDKSFGGDGKVVTHFAEDSYASDVALQADGKIVVAGGVFDAGVEHARFALARYNLDGSLDDTFGRDGRVTAPVSRRGRAFAVAIQADGKIVAGGGPVGGGGRFALARFDQYGSLDPTFGGDGRVKAPSGTLSDIAIQPDGKIVAVGSSEISSFALNFGFAVARYNPDGTPDTTFDRDGKTRTIFRDSYGGSEAYASAVAIQPDGSIVAAGEFRTEDRHGNPLRGFALARYHVNGSADGSFGGDGKVKTRFGQTSAAFSVAVQTDGRIVAAGVIADLSDVVPSRFAVIRYGPDGSLDQSFGRDGKRKTRIGFQPSATDVAIQPNGAITVGGETSDRFAIVRYLAA